MGVGVVSGSVVKLAFHAEPMRWIATSVLEGAAATQSGFDALDCRRCVEGGASVTQSEVDELLGNERKIEFSIQNAANFMKSGVACQKI